MDDISEEDKATFKKQYPKFYAAVFDDNEWFSDQLKIAALFIMAFEAFQDYVKGSFEGFFCHEWQRNKNGDLVPVKNANFEKVLAKHSQGKKTGLFEAACNWFQEMGAIDSNDRQYINSLVMVRNDLAHRLFKVLLSEEYPELDANLINGPLNLYYKVSNWWICNVEAGIMPEEYEQFDEDAMKTATSLQVQILSMLANKVKKSPAG